MAVTILIDSSFTSENQSPGFSFTSGSNLITISDSAQIYSAITGYKVDVHYIDPIDLGVYIQTTTITAFTANVSLTVSWPSSYLHIPTKITKYIIYHWTGAPYSGGPILIRNVGVGGSGGGVSTIAYGYVAGQVLRLLAPYDNICVLLTTVDSTGNPTEAILAGDYVGIVSGVSSNAITLTTFLPGLYTKMKVFGKNIPAGTLVNNITTTTVSGKIVTQLILSNSVSSVLGGAFISFNSKNILLPSVTLLGIGHQGNFGSHTATFNLYSQ